jgi:2'-5' RNA ligase
MASAAPAPRLFLALWPDDTVREQLERWRDRWQWPAGAAPTRSERLHLTLHFIGVVETGRLPALGAALASISASKPFVMPFGRPELWPGGIAVVCPLIAPAPLQLLHARLADTLRQLEIPVEERPFKPHVTLARKARAAPLPASGPAFDWEVSAGFALVQSLPAGQGYRVLQTYG